MRSTSTATADGDESAGEDAATVRPIVIGDLGGDVVLGRGDVPLLGSSQCAAQRLPAAVEPRWTVELPDARQIVSPVTAGDESVVAVVGLDDGSANGLGSVAIVALDVDDGQERWRTAVQPATGRHDVLGVVDRAVIVRSFAGPDMAYRRLLAFDEGSGALLWDRGFDGDWSATVNTTTGLVVVDVHRPGASVIEASEVELIGPRTGERVDVVAGELVGFAPDGRVVTRIGDEVLATTGESSDLLGLVEPGGAPFTVLGSQVVVADDEAGTLRVFDGDAEPRQLPLVGSAGIDAPARVVLLAPLGGTSLVVHGNGYVYGAHVGDQTAELRWHVRGVVLASATTDRGRALLTATEGGAQQRVIDSSTGRTIADVVLRPGSLETLTLLANGVVVQESIDGEPVRRALDLDGRELWSLPGSGAFAVGGGVIVDVDDSETPLRITAWGEPASASSGAAGCGAS